MKKSDWFSILKHRWTIASPKRKELYFFLMLASLTWVIGRYIIIGPYTNDNELVTNTLCALFLVQTVGLYYLVGKWFFPRYLYTGKFAVITSFLPLCFLLVYWSNFFVFSLLVPFSDGISVNGGEAWVVRIWKMLSEAGWLGCFTDGIVAYWNFGFSFEMVLLYLAVKIFADILSSRENRRKLEKENIELELRFLKSQINPHFLFNTLNSIYSRTVDVNKEASELVLKLAELMRYSLYRTGKERVSLDDELKYIQNYIDLEKYRYNEVPDICFEIDGPVKGYRIAPLFLIPLVENAFKHGIGGNSDKTSFVRISTVIENSILYFSVENSLSERTKRKVFQPETKTEGGLGIATLRRRLNLLYPTSHSFFAEAFEDRYEVMLQIPLELETVES